MGRVTSPLSHSDNNKNISNSTNTHHAPPILPSAFVILIE